ncbi:MAG TPA: FAD:protein FMN transferase [Streptosporangiaceae bacterium]|jgi:thiamine biosynthesis lipoprotein
MMPAAAGCEGAPASAGWSALGAPVQLVVTEADQLERGHAILAAELIAVDTVCGARPGSELAELSQADPVDGAPARDGHGPVRVSSLLADAIAAALRTARLTGGDVDPVVSGGLAGDGTTRGAADRAGGGPGGGDEGGRAGGTGRTGGTAGGGLDVLLRPLPNWRQVRLDTRSRLLWLPPGLRLDLGGTATAWAADRCAARLAARLGCGVLVGLGGDIAVAGQPPAGGWRIRVQDTTGTDGDGPPTVVAIHDGGLATASASARRMRQANGALRSILDPRASATAAPYWRTVSVAAARCVLARAASSTAMIRGRHAEPWLSSLGLPARLVGLDGRVRTVAGWPGRG